MSADVLVLSYGIALVCLQKLFAIGNSAQKRPPFFEVSRNVLQHHPRFTDRLKSIVHAKLHRHRIKQSVRERLSRYDDA